MSIVVLVATKETQGQRDNDLFETEEGEVLIYDGEECEHDVDAECPCKRSFIGAKTGKRATTFKVVTTDLKPEQVMAMTITRLILNGHYHPEYNPERVMHAEIVCHGMVGILQMASQFPEGTILERRDRQFSVRAVPDYA